MLPSACVANACCCQPWSIQQGETSPLRIDWGPWLNSTGWPSINEIVYVRLLDMMMTPAQPADPNDIKLTAGMGGVEPVNPWPGYALILDGHITEFLVEASPTVKVGNIYRMDIQVSSRDCNGRAITAIDCIGISIVQC